MAKFFDFILQGSEATEENAYSAARGLDWQEIEVTEANYPFLNYVDTVNGVGIWYNYGSDDYYFTDEPEDLMENKKVVKITKEQLQQIVREGVERLHRKSLIENRIKQINEELSEFVKESDTYFDTLSQALDSVRDKAMSLGYEVDEDSMFSNFGTGGISYETTKSANIELLKNGEPILSKSGKPLNRAISISIYRMPSGKYELTAYKTW